MSNGSPRANPPFADTVTGKIVVGLVVAAGSALIAWFVSRATYEPPPEPRPSADIVPESIVARAFETVEFTAEGSRVPSANPPDFSWRISGLEPNRSPGARCTDRGATIGCRFSLPGTFAVAVTVRDTNGQSSSAAASVTVSVPNGYLGILTRLDDADAQRALLYDIDWVRLQGLVGRPILLQDPETGSAVYAALAQPPDEAGTQPSWEGAAAGLKVAIPQLPPEARQEFEIALSEIGMVPVTMPFGEIITATERGAIDLGFVAVDSPDALAALAGDGNR